MPDVTKSYGAPLECCAYSDNSSHNIHKIFINCVLLIQTFEYDDLTDVYAIYE